MRPGPNATSPLRSLRLIVPGLVLALLALAGWQAHPHVHCERSAATPVACPMHAGGGTITPDAPPTAPQTVAAPVVFLELPPSEPPAAATSVHVALTPPRAPPLA